MTKVCPERFIWRHFINKIFFLSIAGPQKDFKSGMKPFGTVSSKVLVPGLVIGHGGPPNIELATSAAVTETSWAKEAINIIILLDYIL